MEGLGGVWLIGLGRFGVVKNRLISKDSIVEIDGFNPGLLPAWRSGIQVGGAPRVFVGRGLDCVGCLDACLGVACYETKWVTEVTTSCPPSFLLLLSCHYIYSAIYSDLLFCLRAPLGVVASCRRRLCFSPACKIRADEGFEGTYGEISHLSP